MNIKIFLDTAQLDNVLLNTAHVEYINTVEPQGINMNTRQPSTVFTICFNMASGKLIKVHVDDKKLLIDGFLESIQSTLNTRSTIHLKSVITKLHK